MARTFTKKLFAVTHEDQPPAYVLADNLIDAVTQWKASSAALTNADPVAVQLVTPDVIGSPRRGAKDAPTELHGPDLYNGFTNHQVPMLIAAMVGAHDRPEDWDAAIWTDAARFVVNNPTVPTPSRNAAELGLLTGN